MKDEEAVNAVQEIAMAVLEHATMKYGQMVWTQKAHAWTSQQNKMLEIKRTAKQKLTDNATQSAKSTTSSPPTIDELARITFC